MPILILGALHTISVCMGILSPSIHRFVIQFFFKKAYTRVGREFGGRFRFSSPPSQLHFIDSIKRNEPTFTQLTLWPSGQIAKSLPNTHLLTPLQPTKGRRRASPLRDSPTLSKRGILRASMA